MTYKRTVKDVLRDARLEIKEKDLVIPPPDTILKKEATIKIFKGKSVFIIVDDRVIKTITHKDNIKEVIQELDIKLGSCDKVTPSLSAKLKDKSCNYIYIKKAKNLIVTVANKSPVNIKSTKRYVYQVLSDMKISLDSEDRIYPVPQTPIVEGMKINVTKVRHKLYAEKIYIPYKIVYRDDPTLEEGKENVAQEGREGVIRYVKKVYYKNHQISSEKLVKKDVLAEPIAKIILVGTKVEPYYVPATVPSIEMASRGSIPSSYVLTMEATAYDPGYRSCGASADGYTATGLPAKYGVVAVDPSVIPMGTRLYIEGYGYAVAADKGTAIKGHRIDLCFNSYDEAIRYGRRTVKVHVLN
ncbi:MAG: Cell wall-binding protein YocH precursor [bacterium ADurb.Bin363]|nr:MAG: Cell wall-binding protein YocH precursor [bacterium ADurb.Bin363]